MAATATVDVTIEGQPVAASLQSAFVSELSPTRPPTINVKSLAPQIIVRANTPRGIRPDAFGLAATEGGRYVYRKYGG
jgi:hypothetical protein